MAATGTSDVYLTVAEAAKRLRVSKMTVYRMVHSGEFPEAKRFGKLIRIPESDVERYSTEAAIQDSNNNTEQEGT